MGSVYWRVCAVLFVGAAAISATCVPAHITDTNDAGCGRWFPRYHPKNAMPLAHNNDANAPFYFNGVYHLFMQATFPGTPGWNGAIGLGHLASRDLVTWKQLPPALLPGKWPGPIGTTGQPGGNTTGGYYSGSATIVHGVPRLMIPAVWGSDHPTASGTGPGGQGNCDWKAMHGSHCVMTYVFSEPLNKADPWLSEWTEPIVMVDGRVDGMQPHGPGFDDLTHAWQDPEDKARDTWRFAGQTTVCKTAACNNRAAGDYPEYLQMWASRNGSDWTAGFESLGNLFPDVPVQDYIANVPPHPVTEIWTRQWPVAFLHFGSDAYWLGNYTREGSAQDQTRFVPVTPQQTLAHGANEGHGFYDEQTGRFIWYGVVGGGCKSEAGVPEWDGYLTVSRHLRADWGLSTAGDFHGLVTQNPVGELATLRNRLLFDQRNSQAGGLPSGTSLDVELNVSWPAGAVPSGFGSVGVSVLGGYQVLVTGSADGSYALQGVPLGPAGRSMPNQLTLRVLVDRSIVESFAQGGRASHVASMCLTGNATSLVWRPSRVDVVMPMLSVRVWSMKTGYL